MKHFTPFGPRNCCCNEGLRWYEPIGDRLSIAPSAVFVHSNPRFSQEGPSSAKITAGSEDGDTQESSGLWIGSRTPVISPELQGEQAMTSSPFLPPELLRTPSSSRNRQSSQQRSLALPRCSSRTVASLTHSLTRSPTLTSPFFTCARSLARWDETLPCPALFFCQAGDLRSMATVFRLLVVSSGS